MASAQTWGQDEHRLLSALFPYLDKEPQEVLKVRQRYCQLPDILDVANVTSHNKSSFSLIQAWGILRDQRRALLTCLTDLLTEPDYFLQAADTIVLVHPDCVPSDQEWVIG